MNLQALYYTFHQRQWLLMLGCCTLMALFFTTRAQASVLDTLPPRDVFSYHNDVGYIDPSIGQFEAAAIELSNSISAIFGVSGLKVYAYAMYPKSHPAGKSLSFSTLWQKELTRIEGEVIALNKPTLRSAAADNYYLYIAWQLDATGKIAEARVRCKLPAAPESECGASESLLKLEESISQAFHSAFVSTYNSTLIPGKAGATAIGAIKEMVKGMEESSFEEIEGPPLPDSCQKVCYPAGSVFITPSRKLIRIEEEICPDFNFGEIPFFPIGCLVSFTTHPGKVKYSTILAHYTPAEVKTFSTLARGCEDTFWAYIKNTEIEKYKDANGKLTNWGDAKTVFKRKELLDPSRFINYKITGAGAVTIKGLENGVFVTYTFNVNLPSSLDLEGPYSASPSIIPPGTSPLCTFCDKNSPGAHYYDRAKKAGMSSEQFLLLCKNARALNELSKKWNINLDKKVDIDRWYDIMQTFYNTPRGVFDNVTPEERLNKLYQFIIYYRENVEFLKNTTKEDIEKLSRIYINPNLVRTLPCQDRMDLIRILCSEGPHKLKGSATIAYKKSEDIILDLMQDIGLDKQCFLEKLIADKATFCVLMQGFIDNGVKSYIFGDGNHKLFIQALIELYFEVIGVYDQAALRALVKTDRIIQVGFSPYVNKLSRCAPIYLDAKFNCNGNTVSGQNSISLGETALAPVLGAVNTVNQTICNLNFSSFNYQAFDLVLVYNYGGNYPVLNALPQNIPLPAFILPYLAQVTQNKTAGEAIQFVSIGIGAISTVGAVSLAIETATTEAIILASLEAAATLGDVVSASRTQLLSLFNDPQRGTALLTKLDNLFLAISVASMRASFNVDNARTAVNALEDELAFANKLSPLYERLRIAINSLRTALKLTGISSDAEFIIRVKAALVATDKAYSDDIVKLEYLHPFKNLIAPKNALSLPHLSDDFLKIYAGGSPKVQDFLKGAIAGWDDPVSFAKFVEDVKARPGLLEKMAGKPRMLNAWKILSELTGVREWVRKSNALLDKMADKSDDFMQKVKQYYSNHQKPANTGTPPFIHQGTAFDEFGHPDFWPEVPNMVGEGKIMYRPEEISNERMPIKNKLNLDGGNSDFTDANRWGAVNFSRDKFQASGSTRCKIKDPTSPFADGDGWVECVWHHHQDAKTLMPVPIQTHNRSFSTGSPHTGGAAILENLLLHDLIGFF